MTPEDAPPSMEALEVARRRQQRQAEEQAKAATREADVTRARKARIAKLKLVETIIQEQAKEDLDLDWQAFLASLKSDLEREDFMRCGWASAVNADAVLDYWSGRFPERFTQSVQ